MRRPRPWLLVGQYRLTVLFGLAALVFVVTAALVISYTTWRIAESNLIRIAEETLTSDAPEMLSMMRQPPRPLTLEALAAPEGLPQQLPMLVQGYSVVKLNLINPEGVLVWSTDRRKIGSTIEVNATSRAAMGGAVTSKVLPDHVVADLDGKRARLSVVRTSVPLRDQGTNQVLGVLEIYQNVNDNVNFLVRAITSSVLQVTAATLSGLFFVLLFLLVRADVAISKSKRGEQLALEN